MANGRRGPHTTDTGTWQRPGGDPPVKPTGPSAKNMTELELEFYKHFRSQVLLVGSAGRVDCQRLIQAARAAAKIEVMTTESRDRPLLTVGGNGQPAMDAVHAAIGKEEARLTTLLDGLHLGPRSRTSTRLSKEDRVNMATKGDETELTLWKLCGGQ